jgi:hypothetical protein
VELALVQQLKYQFLQDPLLQKVELALVIELGSARASALDQESKDRFLRHSLNSGEKEATNQQSHFVEHKTTVLTILDPLKDQH